MSAEAEQRQGMKLLHLSPGLFGRLLLQFSRLALPARHLIRSSREPIGESLCCSTVSLVVNLQREQNEEEAEIGKSF